MKLRTLPEAESGDVRGMNTSDKGNRVSEMASIKHGEDTVLLYKKEGSHDNSGWE